jgi:hypothetical protein
MLLAYKRLYYYTGKHWGLKVLWEKRLKLSRYADVNDPFELLPYDRTRKRSREFWDKQVARLLSSRYGFVCLSEDWRTTLMWSHYGEKHTGICLGFDVLKDIAEQISYTDYLLADPVDYKKELRGVSMQVLQRALSYKFSGWSYEREWRVRVRLGTAIDGIYYKGFGDDVMLREVIIGPRCTLSVQDAVDAVRGHPLAVEVFTARAAFGTFEVCRQQQVHPRTIEGFRSKLARLPDVMVNPLEVAPDDA